jgi:hypothetical protein
LSAFAEKFDCSWESGLLREGTGRTHEFRTR